MNLKLPEKQRPYLRSQFKSKTCIKGKEIHAI